MSACRNSKLCPCLLALDCWRITCKQEVVQLERIFTMQSRSNLIGHRAKLAWIRAKVVRAEGLEPSWAV